MITCGTEGEDQFVLAVGGYVRNAWNDVMVHLPDGSRRKLAAILRRELRTQPAQKPLPAQAALVAPPVEAAKHAIAMEIATAWPYEERRSLKVYTGDIPFD